MFHATAIIHPDAEIARDVEIGPCAVIEGAARIGAGCVIQAHAIIGAHVVMGERNVIGYGAVIGADPQDFAFKATVLSEVRIGSDNRIREYTTIHRGTTEGSATVVGDRCFLMAGAHLGARLNGRATRLRASRYAEGGILVGLGVLTLALPHRKASR